MIGFMKSTYQNLKNKENFLIPTISTDYLRYTHICHHVSIFQYYLIDFLRLLLRFWGTLNNRLCRQSSLCLDKQNHDIYTSNSPITLGFIRQSSLQPLTIKLHLLPHIQSLLLRWHIFRYTHCSSPYGFS